MKPETLKRIAAIQAEANFYLGMAFIAFFAGVAGIAGTVVAIQFGATIPCGLPCN